MKPRLLDRSREGSALILTLARDSARNAISSELANSLAQELSEAAHDEAIRGVVITARGPVFAAGGDLVQLSAAMQSADGAERVLELGRLLQNIETCPLPVIAAIGGAAYGGGSELVLLFDYVIAEESASFELRHVRMGLSPAWGAASRLLERLGPQAAMRALLTAEKIDAQRARALGLVAEVCAEGKALSLAIALIEQVAQADRQVIAENKRGLWLARQAQRALSAPHEAEIFRGLWNGPAHQRSMKAFFERKKAARAKSPKTTTT